MVEKKSWDEFRETGLLWWINMILHTFGWSIVYEVEYEQIIDVYPARVKYRGFKEQVNDKGYENISKYLKENIDELLKEAEIQ
jgi:hypothetical protein